MSQGGHSLKEMLFQKLRKLSANNLISSQTSDTVLQLHNKNIVLFTIIITTTTIIRRMHGIENIYKYNILNIVYTYLLHITFIYY